MLIRGCLPIVLCLGTLTSACGSDGSDGSGPSEPVTGALELTVSTTGGDLDPDGYTLTIDTGTPVAAPTNGTITIPDLRVGQHRLALAGLAGNCALATPAPLEVTVPGTAGVAVTVEITCTTIYTLAYRGESGVELTDAAGTVHRTLVPGDADPLAWSPDGRLLAVSKNDEVIRLWIASLDDGGLRRLSSFGERIAVWNTVGVWSPDGRELLLETIQLSHTSPTGLTRYPLDESYPPQGVYGVILGMNEGHVIGVAGSHVAGLVTGRQPDRDSRDGEKKTYILSRDGTSQRLLAEGVQPAWSPDGGAIAYVASVSGHGALRLIHPDGSNDRQLTAPATNETDAGPAWSPDGSKMAFLRKGLAPDSSVTSVLAYVVDRDGTNERQLAVLPVAISSHLVCRWLAPGVFGTGGHLRGQCGWQ